MKSWVWFLCTHGKSRYGCSFCNYSTGEAKTGGSLGLPSQPVFLNQWVPGSVRIPTSKNKLESDWERHLTLNSDLIYTHSEAIAAHTLSNYPLYGEAIWGELVVTGREAGAFKHSGVWGMINIWTYYMCFWCLNRAKCLWDTHELGSFTSTWKAWKCVSVVPALGSQRGRISGASCQ